MAIRSSLTDLDAQIEKLRERRKLLIVKSAERFAKAATRSGLAELEIADEEVERIFDDIATRFRSRGKKPADGAAAKAPRQSDERTGAEEAISNDGRT